jgi:hypothetical protein
VVTYVSDVTNVEKVLNRATKQENEYHWTEAVESYNTALTLVREQDFLERAQIHERIGYGFFRAAMQMKNAEEFKNHMQRSAEAYDKAAELFDTIDATRSLYCRALAKYSCSWFAEPPSQKRELLDDSLKLLEEVLGKFDGAGNQLGCTKAFRAMSFCLWDRYGWDGDWRDRKRIVETIERGEAAAAKLSETGKDVKELAWTCTMTMFLAAMYEDLFEETKAERLSKVSAHALISNLSEKVIKLSGNIDDSYLLFYIYYTLAFSNLFAGGDWQLGSKYFEDCLRQTERLNDHFLLGLIKYAESFIEHWTAVTEEDPDKRREKCKKSIRLGEEAIQNLISVCRHDLASWACSSLIEDYCYLAELEGRLEEKHALLKKAVEIGRRGSEYAQLSCPEDVSEDISHGLSKALLFLSQTESVGSEKKKQLEEALVLREESIHISDNIYPQYSWNHGVFQNYLALIKTDLARLQESKEKKRSLLEEAISNMEKCVETCEKYLQMSVSAAQPRNFAVLGWYYDWFGDILDELYSLTPEEKITGKAIEVYQSSAQVYQKAGMPSRVAEAYWKTARLHDQRGEYNKGADSFELASRSYQAMAEKIPQLKNFYQDHATYMQAWREVEKARHHHAKQEYGLAMEHFEKAANIHKSLKQWNYLAPNYFAWVHLESAEELSRKEQSEEAIKAFEEAANLFRQTEESIRTEFSKIEDPHEKAMVTGLSKASELRHEYCMGRITLEQARILDKKGDHSSSSEHYGSAAQTFARIAKALETDQEKKELELITTLSLAWQKMTEAEAETSPALYSEASQLFEEAKELGSNEKAKMLALGHSRFCKALEAGTRFADTRDTTLYTVAEQHLESAANYYAKAGFQNASEYSKAMGHMFDAYVYIDDAKREKDPEKKARLYAMAEKVLQSSAGSFMKAEHPEKMEQVQRLLEKVKEERELALSLNEMLHAPSVVSTTATFVTPAPTSENAVGLERFEHADIQANIIARQKELRIGENLNLEIELVNAGKGPALLIKIAEIVPQDFEWLEKPEHYHAEDSYLNMKGKRLDPLKTEELKVILKPKAQGEFKLKPKILYIDENGKYRSHEPEPVTITVKELGIKGWLKGER